MNIIVWILQVLLGLWHITGSIYMTTHYQDLISAWAADFFPSYFWIVLGAIQVLLSLGLIFSLVKKFRKLAPVSAIGLAIISLLGIPYYTAYSGFPGMLWGIIPAILLVFVAYWRGTK
jgi:hypothetical protein